MKKQNIAIIAAIALVLAVSVGYALFSQSLTVTGTATAKGDFDVQFTAIGNIKSEGYTDANATETDTDEIKKSRIASISNNGHDLTITVNKLDYPGAYVEIPVTITNEGTIPAKLKNIEETNLTDTGRAVKVSYSGVAASDVAINSKATQDMLIRVEWDQAVNEGNQEAASFKIKLNYEQITASTTAG